MKKIKKHKKTAILALPKLDLRWFYLLGGITLFLLLSLYIYQVNAETSEKYFVQGFEKRLFNILEENNLLKINSAKIASLDNIAQAIEGLGFEKINKVYYIQVMDSQVVTK